MDVTVKFIDYIISRVTKITDCQFTVKLCQPFYITADIFTH